jgi:hypothetical protein
MPTRQSHAFPIALSSLPAGIHVCASPSGSPDIARRPSHSASERSRASSSSGTRYSFERQDRTASLTSTSTLAEPTSARHPASFQSFHSSQDKLDDIPDQDASWQAYADSHAHDPQQLTPIPAGRDSRRRSKTVDHSTLRARSHPHLPISAGGPQTIRYSELRTQRSFPVRPGRSESARAAHLPSHASPSRSHRHSRRVPSTSFNPPAASSSAIRRYKSFDPSLIAPAPSEPEPMPLFPPHIYPFSSSPRYPQAPPPDPPTGYLALNAGHDFPDDAPPVATSQRLIALVIDQEGFREIKPRFCLRRTDSHDGTLEFVATEQAPAPYHQAAMQAPPTLKRLVVEGLEGRDFLTKQASLQLRSNGFYEVEGREGKSGRYKWRFVYEVRDRLSLMYRPMSGEKVRSVSQLYKELARLTKPGISIGSDPRLFHVLA